jgi:hypothetical protein
VTLQRLAVGLGGASGCDFRGSGCREQSNLTRCGLLLGCCPANDAADEGRILRSDSRLMSQVSRLSARLRHDDVFEYERSFMIRGFRPAVFGLILAAALLPTGSRAADPSGHSESEHDEVRIAVERGEIKPLAELLRIVNDKISGEIAGVEIERKHNLWLYEFRVIDNGGRLFEVYVDANSGDIKRVKEK